MKPKSVWFNTLVGSMSQYGLVETSEGEVRITELTKTILYGESNEVAKGKTQAVRNHQTRGKTPAEVAGIGNTAIACIRLGVDYIGFEIDELYVQIAERMVKRELSFYIKTGASG